MYTDNHRQKRKTGYQPFLVYKWAGPRLCIRTRALLNATFIGVGDQSTQSMDGNYITA